MSADTRPHIIPIAIEDEMRKAYIDYALSVITSRALPDAYDGLKPVQRRLLYAYHELGLSHNKPYKKTVRGVGDVLGKYHPHGDSAVYEALVRLAQPWSLRIPLIDGHGNFGSPDGDPPAAMRYTEARLQRIAEEGLLSDLDKNTVDHRPNFDNSLTEPTVLPGPFPNLLVNGASGIAVGMATNLAPHNLNEVSQAIQATIDHPDITIDELMAHIQAPDFPTGGIIYGTQGVHDAFHTGKGRLILRAKAEIVQNSAKTQIIVTEIPYLVNKATLIEKTIHLVNHKQIHGIADLRDESDKEGLRVVYDLKRDAVPRIVLNNLYKKTNLQIAFHVNNLALVKGKPKLLNLKQLIECYITHRHNVITRRTQEEKKQAAKLLHLLQGYLTAIKHIDPIIRLIKSSPDAKSAQQTLIQNYQLSGSQAKAILEMRLQKLTSLEHDKLRENHDKTEELLANLEQILTHRPRRMALIKEELSHIQKRYGEPRRTAIEHNATQFSIEDTIPNEPMVITLSEQGYIKRSHLNTYKLQHRGGVGAKGVTTKKQDFPHQIIVAHAHDTLLLFTEKGKVHWTKVHLLPEGSKIAQGRAIQNILSLAPDDSVRSIIKVPNLKDQDYIQNHCVVFATQKGTIKKTKLDAFTRPLSKGIRAITFKEQDRLLEARLVKKEDYIVLALRSGKAVCFPESEVRSMGRAAAGVRGITLGHSKDEVIGMVNTPHTEESHLLVISEKGYGKRSSIQDYRITRRGARGVKTLQITPKTGDLIAIKAVESNHELLIMNTSGLTIRIAIETLRTMRRATQGVRLVKLRKEDAIAAVVTIKNIKQPEEKNE